MSALRGKPRAVPFPAWPLRPTRRRHEGDLNIRGAFLHMAAAAAVSAGVVLAGLAIVLTGKTWIDPVTSLVIVAVVAVGTWGLLRDSVNMSLQAAPAGIDPARIGLFLRKQKVVKDVHDLRVWPISTTEPDQHQIAQAA